MAFTLPTISWGSGAPVASATTWQTSSTSYRRPSATTTISTPCRSNLAFDSPLVKTGLRKEDAILHGRTYRLPRPSRPAKSAQLTRRWWGSGTRATSASPPEKCGRSISVGRGRSARRTPGSRTGCAPSGTTPSRPRASPASPRPSCRTRRKETAIAACFERSHRGFFLVEEVDERQAHLVDVWSGAELLVRVIDDTQALTLEHAEGPMNTRVSAMPGSAELVVLPGAYHHPAEHAEEACNRRPRRGARARPRHEGRAGRPHADGAHPPQLLAREGPPSRTASRTSDRQDNLRARPFPWLRLRRSI